MARTPTHDDSPKLSDALAALAARIDDALGESGERIAVVPGLTLYRNTAATTPEPCMYEPSLLVVPQGTKRVSLGNESYVFGRDTFFLTSLELPIVSQVLGASVDAPYLALFLTLDMQIVRDVLNMQEIRIAAPGSPKRGMAVGEASVELIATCSRMIDLLDAPDDVSFVGTLLRREIVYRLLQGTLGERLRSIATLGNQSSRTAKAVGWLRENFEKPLDVDRLAAIAGMSRSTMHYHFRELTAMSPLQFQKQLRLQAARRKMIAEEIDAASAAFEVGYESPSQFNREYKRFFGKPPMRDVRDIRANDMST